MVWDGQKNSVFISPTGTGLFQVKSKTPCTIYAEVRLTMLQHGHVRFDN